MQRPKRALLYGLAIWLLWVSLVIAALELLPAEATGSSLFAALKFGSLGLLVLGFAVLYLRAVGRSSFNEGLLVGLSWMVITIALDLAHYLMVPFDIPRYAVDVAPSYVIMPITTAVVLGCLLGRPVAPEAADADGPGASTSSPGAYQASATVAGGARRRSDPAGANAAPAVVGHGQLRRHALSPNLTPTPDAARDEAGRQALVGSAAEFGPREAVDLQDRAR